MAKKPTRIELEERIKDLQPYELLASLRYGKAPIMAKETIEAKNWGKVQVTVNYYGHGRADGGVVEVVAQPLCDDGSCGTARPLVEVHSYDAISDLLGLFVNEPSRYTPPWGHVIRWALTDGVRLANEAENECQLRQAIGMHRAGCSGCAARRAS